MTTPGVIARSIVSFATAATSFAVTGPSTRNSDGGAALAIGPQHTLVALIVNRDFSIARYAGPAPTGWTQVGTGADGYNSSGSTTGVFVRQGKAGDSGASLGGFGFQGASRGNVMLGLFVLEGVTPDVSAFLVSTGTAANGGNGSYHTGTVTAPGAANVLRVALFGAVVGASTPTVTNTPNWDFFTYQKSPWDTAGVAILGAATVAAPDLPLAAFDYNPAPGIDNSPYVRATLTFPLATTPDTTPPTVPANLRVTSVTQTSVSLAWDASTDDRGGPVTYTLRRGGSTLITGITGTTRTVTGLTTSTAYSFDIRAQDAVPNVSAYSAAITATTAPTQEAATGIQWRVYDRATNTWPLLTGGLG